jgi:hypothetical protein
VLDPDVSFLRHQIVAVIARACRSEIDDLPEEVRGDRADALARPEGAWTMTKSTSADRLAKPLGIPKSRGLEADIKVRRAA